MILFSELWTKCKCGHWRRVGGVDLWRFAEVVVGPSADPDVRVKEVATVVSAIEARPISCAQSVVLSVPPPRHPPRCPLCGLTLFLEDAGVSPHQT